MDLKFEIDVEALMENLQNTSKQLESDIIRSAHDLASMTHAKTLELARDGLGSLTKTYTDQVEFENPEENLWVIKLNKPALFIEDGRAAGFQRDLLNGKSAKTNKKGEKYAIIPFTHNKPPSQQSSTAHSLAQEIKKALKKEGINWKKPEVDASGSPRIGKIHSFSFDSARLKAHHKTPATYGVSVYQSKGADGQVRKDVMTFRVITERHESEGKWMHPGMTGKKFFDKSFQWATDEWENKILPAILEKYQ